MLTLLVSEPFSPPVLPFTIFDFIPALPPTVHVLITDPGQDTINLVHFPNASHFIVFFIDSSPSGHAEAISSPP